MNESKGECGESEKIKKDVEAMDAKKMNESKGECVCVCERERERERKRKKERKKNPRLVFKLYTCPCTFCFLSQVISNTIIHVYNTVYYYFGLNKI